MPQFELPNFENIANTDVAKGVAIGAGVVAFAALALPVVLRTAKPVARGMIKAALLASEKAREAVAEAGEALEDIVAEVHAELAEDRNVAEATAATNQSADLAE